MDIIMRYIVLYFYISIYDLMMVIGGVEMHYTVCFMHRHLASILLASLHDFLFAYFSVPSYYFVSIHMQPCSMTRQHLPSMQLYRSNPLYELYFLN